VVISFPYVIALVFFVFLNPQSSIVLVSCSLSYSILLMLPRTSHRLSADRRGYKSGRPEGGGRIADVSKASRFIPSSTIRIPRRLRSIVIGVVFALTTKKRPDEPISFAAPIWWSKLLPLLNK
jgi:hypothetical protein